MDSEYSTRNNASGHHPLVEVDEGDEDDSDDGPKKKYPPITPAPDDMNHMIAQNKLPETEFRTSASYSVTTKRENAYNASPSTKHHKDNLTTPTLKITVEKRDDDGDGDGDGNGNGNDDGDSDGVNISNETFSNMHKAHQRYNTAIATPSSPRKIETERLTTNIQRRNSEERYSEKKKKTKKWKEETIQDILMTPIRSGVRFNMKTPISMTPIFRKNHKFVRIADLVVRDEAIEKFKNQSRRSSYVSDRSRYSIVDNNDTVEEELGGHLSSNADIVAGRLRSGSKQAKGIDFDFGLHLDETETMRMHHTQYTPMFMSPTVTNNLDNAFNKAANDMNDRNDSKTNNKSIKSMKSDDGESKRSKENSNANGEVTDDGKIETDQNGNLLRDFQSDDGKITYTEIEVSVLTSGNFFGETSLMKTDEDDTKDPTPTTPLEKKNSGNTNLMQLLSQSPRMERKSTKKLFDEDNHETDLLFANDTTFRCISPCVIYSISSESLDQFFEKVPSAKRWFDLMLSKYNVDLDTVLQIPRASRYFTLFLESEYAEENIHYVLSVNEFKMAFDNCAVATQWEMAKIISDNFISDSGNQQINVSGNSKKQILQRIGNQDIDQNMFDATQKAIYILLQRDCFPRFKQSQYFREFLNEAENLTLVTKEKYDQRKQEENEQIRRESTFKDIAAKNKLLDRTNKNHLYQDSKHVIVENIEASPTIQK